MTNLDRQLDALPWRSIGPTRGGRVVAVAGHPTEPACFYFGSTGGGVWKTASAGQRWENVSDGYFRRASVGALAVAPSDPNVIYAGMGETTIRNNVSHGDGIYRSTDGGRSWQHCGLAPTRHIGKIRIHPRDPNRVYVAAFGHAHGQNPERGLYRWAPSGHDGGETWSLLLHRSDRAGAVDLAMDARNPRILFAAFWEGRRGAHYMTSGGPGSALFRTRDGGDSWEDLSERPGFPEGNKGKIGVTVSPARPQRIWTIVEHSEGGLFRSDDGGDSWQRVNADGELRQRAWYYSHVIADPGDPETVWVLNLDLWKSIDGGRTFTKLTTPHVDHHDLWIDPANPQRMILGCDGGATVSLNGGADWSDVNNQPTGEFYHVTADTQTPYRIYGAQQDNSTIRVPSRTGSGRSSPADWYRVGGGESGYIAVRPDDPDIVFAGDQQGLMTRYDHRTGELRDVSIWPEHVWGTDAKDQRYRFAWTHPIVLSPHDPQTIYAGGNHVFRSLDEGATWKPLSPDLTRNDPALLQPAGPIGENARGEAYGTVFALAESPLEPGLIWAGSDDGRVHISRDSSAGTRSRVWQDITPPTDLLPSPEGAPPLISTIEPSPHDAGSAYLAAERHKSNDFRPYLFKTSDYGQTWTLIVDGIPDDDFTRVIRADPVRRGLLFAGTETGVYVSFDDGGRWLRFGQDTSAESKPSTSQHLPVVPVHDLIVKDDELVVCTHGRGFWILDDVTTLRQWQNAPEATPVHLFKSRDTCRWSWISQWSPINTNGVIVRYVLPDPPEGEINLSFRDDQDREIIGLTSAPPVDGSTAPVIPAIRGLNQFVWDLRYPDPPGVETDGGDRMNARGPRVVPGRYSVQLSAGGESRLEEFRILADPRVPASQADLEAQFDLLMRIHETLTRTNEAINKVRSLRRQVEEWMGILADSEAAAGLGATRDRLLDALAEIEGELIQVEANNMEDTLRFPARLNAKLAWLSMTVAGSAAAPTQQAQELFDELAEKVNTQLERLDAVVEAEVRAFNERFSQLAIRPIID